MSSKQLCCALFVALVFLLSQNVRSIPLAQIVNTNGSTAVVPLGQVDLDVDKLGDNVTTNGTQKDLYVIKAVVYEIGILTEVDDNATEADDFSHERVDLTFFDAHSNGSHFDLGQIPLPVQTNVTGQILTGIAPIHLGAIQNASDVLSTLPLTGTIINITHSDTSFINLSHRPAVTENGTILNAEDIAKIPGLNGTTAIFFESPGSAVETNDDNTDKPDTD